MQRSQEEEVMECEQVVRWAQGKSVEIVQGRLRQLLQTNSYAQELYGPKSEDFGNGVSENSQPYLSNHSGYSCAGSESWEHDNNGPMMNYSGVLDDVMNAFIEHEGWRPEENFSDKIEE